MAQAKQPTFVSPAGIAVYPWITKADTKFNPGGDYRCKLRMPSEVAQPLIDKIEEARGKAIAEKKQKVKGKPVKEATLPYSDVYDDEGNQTGEIEFNFKAKATVALKDGSTFTRTIKVFDTKNKPLPEGTDIWGGSKLKIAYQMNVFDTAIGVGVSLRMVAVQVIDLVQGGAGGTGSSYGFGEEEGYVAEEKPAATEFSSDEEADGGDDPSDF